MKNKVLKYSSIVISIILAGWIILGIRNYENEIEQKVKEQEIINASIRKEWYQERDRVAKIKETLPEIVCWGDSLTAGAGGEGVTYPSVLAAEIKLKVYNYGVGGENTNNIAYRQGAMPIYVAPITIPSERVPVEVEIVNDVGDTTGLLKQGDAGLNPCSIGGIEGKLSRDKETNKTYFTRSQIGERIELKEKKQIITDGMQNKKIIKF